MHLRTPGQNPILQVAITPQLPSYWSGIIDFSYLPEVEVQDFQVHFLPIFYGWIDSSPIAMGISGCTGTCKATVRAPALAVNHCESTISRRSFLDPISKSELKNFEAGCITLADNQTIFKNYFKTLNGTVEAFAYETTLTDDNVAKTCVGNVNETTCSMLSATAEYDVIITDGIITFPQAPSYPRIVSRANNTAITDATVKQYGLAAGLAAPTYRRTTLGGIAMSASIAYWIKQGLVAYPGGQSNPGLAPPPVKYVFQHITNYAEMYPPTSDCAPAWKDPRDDVMASLNELLFRVGVDTAARYSEDYLKDRLDPGLEIKYNVTGVAASAVEMYHSDFRWYAGAASLELFCIFAILFTFYGWWDLGRHFTFSPLEIAKVSTRRHIRIRKFDNSLMSLIDFRRSAARKHCLQLRWKCHCQNGRIETGAVRRNDARTTSSETPGWCKRRQTRHGGQRLGAGSFRA